MTAESTQPAEARSKDDGLAEILENTRMLTSRMRKLESETEKMRISSGFVALSCNYERNGTRWSAFRSNPQSLQPAVIERINNRNH